LAFVKYELARCDVRMPFIQYPLCNRNTRSALAMPRWRCSKHVVR
jgi:hypothetical protein